MHTRNVPVRASLLGLREGTFWRGTLAAWSAIKQSMRLTNAQREGPEMDGLGVGSKTFSFASVREVRGLRERVLRLGDCR